MNKKFGKKITACVLICDMMIYLSTPLLAYTKDESVYSKLDANGKVYKTTVSDHLKNTENLNLLKDLSDLVDIENVSGDQELKEENGTLIWDAQGEDIYYQGSTEKELPIKCKITYRLNGKEIDKENIVGKSGNVKITLEFENKEKRKVTINGKEETMYVPFTVVMGTIIDNEKNKNIEITNGKIIDNGNKTIAFGISLPGMQESLGISKDEIEIPNKIELSMKAKDFEMKEIYCFATPKLIEENELDVFDDLDKVYDLISDLNNASEQLVNSSSKLSAGASKINNGIHQLTGALNTQISKYEDARKLLANKKEIEEKIVNIINDEIKKLAPELGTLAEKEASNIIKNNKEEIEKKTVETAIKYTDITIKGKLEELSNKKEGIIKISDELVQKIQSDIQNALKNVSNREDVKALEEAIKKAVTQEVTDTVKSNTAEILNSKLQTIKTSVSDPTSLLTGDEAIVLDTSKEEIAKTMALGIQAQYAQNGINLSDEEALKKARESVNSLVGNVSKSTMDKTLDIVAQKTPEMVDATVQEIVTKLNSSEEVTKAILTYENKIISEIKYTLGEETLTAVEENIKIEIIEELENAFTDEKKVQEIIQTYGNKAKAELNSTIDTIAENTAKELANEFTQKLAGEIASNLIEKQLNGELSGTQLDKEISKYEELIDSKLGSVDSQIGTLKSTLEQLTNGTDNLAYGTSKLAEGMNDFDTKAIKKIYNYIDENVKDLEQRAKKLKDLADEYQSFTKYDDTENEGNVKFIMMIDNVSIKEEKQEKQSSSSEVKTEGK